MSNKNEVYNIWKRRGYSDDAIAGILGNIDVETGGSFDHTQQQKGGPGYGLFQFDPGMGLMPHYQNYLKWNKQLDSTESQIGFVDTLIKDGQYAGSLDSAGYPRDVIGRGNARTLRESLRTGTPAETAESFMDIIEQPRVPHLQRRIDAATIPIQPEQTAQVQSTAPREEPAQDAGFLSPVDDFISSLFGGDKSGKPKKEITDMIPHKHKETFKSFWDELIGD
jgi:hypothetical protein